MDYHVLLFGLTIVYSARESKGQGQKTDWTCTLVREVYSRVNALALFQFDVSGYLSQHEGTQSFSIAFYNGTPLGSIIFLNPPGNKPDSVAGVTISADNTGKINVTLANVKDEHSGTYRIYGFSGTLGCSCLYILGVPTKPEISFIGNPVVGGNVTLSCTSKSTTKPSNGSITFMYSWDVGKTANPTSSKYIYSTNNDTLTIKDIAKEDASKHISCSVKEDVTNGYQSNSSDPIYLDVWYAPDGPPVITPYSNGSEYRVIEGTQGMLSCSVIGGNPAPTLTWDCFNSGANQTTSSGTVTRVHTWMAVRGQDSTCTCRSSHYSGNRSVSVNVIIMYPPTMPIFTIGSTEVSKIVKAIRHNSLSVICSSSGQPEPSYKWKRTYPNISASNGPLLSVDSVQSNLTYTCEVQNTMATSEGIVVTKSNSSSINVILLYPPKIGNLPNISVVEGSPVTVFCPLTVGNPPETSVEWIQNGQVFNRTQNFTILTTSRTDAMFYTCRISNKMQQTGEDEVSGPSSKSFYLNILYAPNVTVILSNPNTTENMPLTISCNAVGQPNVYTYISITQTWKNQSIREYKNPEGGVLRINNLQLHDSGTYTCVVSNGIRDRNNQSNQTGEKELIIKVSPNVLLDKILKFPGAVGASVDIKIPFFCHPKIGMVTFTHQNGTEIKNSSKYEVYYRRENVTTKFYGQLVELEGYLAVLHIENEESSDFANYTLTLKNGVGPAKEWILEHVPESKPSAPGNLSYIGISNGVSTFSFVGGFNGGKPQTFIIEITVHGTDNWKEQLRFNETDVKFHMDDKSTFRFDITGLEPNIYRIRVLSENSFGRIEVDEAKPIKFAIKNTEPENPSSPVSAIVGGSFAALVVIAIVAVITLLRRKRLKNKDGRSTAISSRRHREDSESSDEVMTENIAYVSAEEVSKAVKPRAGQEIVYAQPEKKKMSLQETNVKKDSKKDNKKARKNKLQKTEDVYENAPELTSVRSSVIKVGKDVSRCVYENPDVSNLKQKKNTNKDGLIYADLAFNDRPKKQKKLIIHGLDDMTEYIQVDFTKKADPLPDSDEETNK